jgi:hypothetical protein
MCNGNCSCFPKQCKHDQVWGTKKWIKRELEENLPGGLWIEVPKFIVFSVESAKFNRIKEEVITFSVTYSPKTQTLLYGFSIKAPQDQYWKSYGKAIAKSRLRQKIEKNSYSFRDMIPIENYETNQIFANGSASEEERRDSFILLAKLVYAHFLKRIELGDDLNSKLPQYIREDLIQGSPSVILPSFSTN